MVANQTGANTNLPAPFHSINTIINKFAAVGLDITDVVALSGSPSTPSPYVQHEDCICLPDDLVADCTGGHTIGRARCLAFRSRLLSFSPTGSADPSLDSTMASELRSLCLQDDDGSTAVALDRSSVNAFDNHYFSNLLNQRGLLSSDQGLFSSDEGVAATKDLVEAYSKDAGLFLKDFANSMIKMGNISPLTGSAGEIRKNCRVVN